MSPKEDEITRRKQVALVAIREALATEDDETGVGLFVSHHLEEIGADEWQAIAGTPMPSPQQILNLLVLRSHWGTDDHDDYDEEGIDSFDFTLPGDATQYVICVRFSADGKIEDISMES